MANKRAHYEVDFSLSKLTLAEQDRFYQKLMSILDQDLKDKLNIRITDLIGGQHYLFDGKGVRPDGIECTKCVFVDCAQCKIWKKILELENEVKEMEK